MSNSKPNKLIARRRFFLIYSPAAIYIWNHVHHSPLTAKTVNVIIITDRFLLFFFAALYRGILMMPTSNSSSFKKPFSSSQKKIASHLISDFFFLAWEMRSHRRTSTTRLNRFFLTLYICYMAASKEKTKRKMIKSKKNENKAKEGALSGQKSMTACRPSYGFLFNQSKTKWTASNR